MDDDISLNEVWFVAKLFIVKKNSLGLCLSSWHFYVS